MSQLCLLQCMMHNMETCWTCPGHCAQFLGDHCGPLPQNMSLMCCKCVGLFCGAPSVRLFNRGALLCAMCWLQRQFWTVVCSRPVIYFVEYLCDRPHGNYAIACHASVSLSVTMQAIACVCVCYDRSYQACGGHTLCRGRGALSHSHCHVICSVGGKSCWMV